MLTAQYSPSPSHDSATLSARLHQTHAFLDPQNLSDLLIKYEGEVGVLAIDVQKHFCDPADAQMLDGELWGGNEDTKAASKRIRSVIPQFRKAGVPIYSVYFSDLGEDLNCYEYIPAVQDTIILKNQTSAFRGGNIEEVLNNDGRKLLLTCGFNYSACVCATIEDARSAGFEVCVMDDLTKDGAGFAQGREYTTRMMECTNITATTSKAALSAVRSLHP